MVEGGNREEGDKMDGRRSNRKCDGGTDIVQDGVVMETFWPKDR